MSQHNADLHALRNEVNRLNNELKQKDLEIAALQASQVNANRAAGAGVETDDAEIDQQKQAEYEGMGHPKSDAQMRSPAREDRLASSAKEDFTTSSTMGEGISKAPDFKTGPDNVTPDHRDTPATHTLSSPPEPSEAEADDRSRNVHGSAKAHEKHGKTPK